MRHSRLAKMMMLMGGGARPIFSDNFAAALSDSWVNNIGEFETNGGIARSKTLAVSGRNLITNSEFTDDLTGWTPGGYGEVLTRRDFTHSPDIDPSGGSDEFGMEVLHGTANYGNVRWIHSDGFSWYVSLSVRAYSPTGNTNKAQMKTITGGQDVTQLAFDTWQSLAADSVSRLLTPTMQLGPGGNTINDVVYFDTASMRKRLSIATVDVGVSNVRFEVKVTPPAVNAFPFGVVSRYTDDTHYWLWRIEPNTAGMDFRLIEINGSLETTRDQFDMDWANVQYSIKIECYGTTYRASVNNIPTLEWEDAGNFNTTATKVGLWDSGVNNAIFDDVAIYEANSITYNNYRILGIGDSITAGTFGYNPPVDGENGYLYKLEQSLIGTTGNNWYEQRIAYGGYTATQIKNLIDAQLALIKITPGYVLVCLGTNNEAEAAFEASYGYILDAVHTKYPSAVIITCDVNATLNGHLADVIATRPWASIAFDISDLGWGGTHPNEAECIAMAALWKTAMGY